MSFANYPVLANSKGEGRVMLGLARHICNTARQVANSLLQEISWNKQLDLCAAT
jgi:hypothetical protein